MRTIVEDMLSKEPDFEVIGVASDGIEALRMIESTNPDVMTLDIEMPRMDGLEVLRQRKTVRKFPKTLMLSSLTSKDALATKTAIELGADDFMLKPKGINTVRGIERELIERIRNLISIKYIQRAPEANVGDIATRCVVVGSSAGGPPMLDVLLSNLPSTLDASVVITQHMPEGGFTAALANRLNRLSPLPVKETENGDILFKGHVFISKAGFHTVISGFINAFGKTGGKIVHTKSPPVHNVRPAVDKTFTSAAHVYKENIVSVLLSGMGSDGGEGTEVIKGTGGKTMVCREEDCLVYGMPRSALERNAVDKVLPLRLIPKEISELIAGMSR